MRKYNKVERDGRIMDKRRRVSTDQIEICCKGGNVGLVVAIHIIEGGENGTFGSWGARRANNKNGQSARRISRIEDNKDFFCHPKSCRILLSLELLNAEWFPGLYLLHFLLLHYSLKHIASK